MREKLATCVLFSSKNKLFGPTFLRPDDGKDLLVYPESENELALVYAFLSLAELAQFEFSDITEVGRFYNNIKAQQENPRKSLREETTEARAEELQSAFFATNTEASKRRRIELKPDTMEGYARRKIITDEEKARTDIQKQLRLNLHFMASPQQPDTANKRTRLEKGARATSLSKSPEHDFVPGAH